MQVPNRFIAPLATLALVAFVAGCPNNATQTPPTDPKTSKKPASAEPSDAASATPSTAASTATSSVAPSQAPASTPATLPPASPTASTATSPVPSASTVATVSASPSTAVSTAPAVAYTQVERLARPAINEGLIRDPDLLNAWNSVGPDKDMTDAGAPIRTNAVGTLTALGNNQAQIDAIVAQFLPDVIRIDTTITSGYVSPAGGDPNAFTNLSATKKIPIGGRMVKDDVIDATMAVLVPGGMPGAAAQAGLESDGVSYEANHDPLLSDFPYLAKPN